MTSYADKSWWVTYKNTSDSQHRSAVRFFDGLPDATLLWTPWQRVEIFYAFRQLQRSRALPRQPANHFIRALENEVHLGYGPHVEFDWTEAERSANELSAVHSRNFSVRAMDLFHGAIACEIGAELFLTFDEDQETLAKAAGLMLWPDKP
jgi:predicted nucleic acid-binding protein